MPKYLVEKSDGGVLCIGANSKLQAGIIAAKYCDNDEEILFIEPYDGKVTPINLPPAPKEPSVYDGMTEAQKREAHDIQVRAMMDGGA